MENAKELETELVLKMADSIKIIYSKIHELEDRISQLEKRGKKRLESQGRKS